MKWKRKSVPIKCRVKKTRSIITITLINDWNNIDVCVCVRVRIENENTDQMQTEKQTSAHRQMRLSCPSGCINSVIVFVSYLSFVVGMWIRWTTSSASQSHATNMSCQISVKPEGNMHIKSRLYGKKRTNFHIYFTAIWWFILVWWSHATFALSTCICYDCKRWGKQ